MVICQRPAFSSVCVLVMSNYCCLISALVLLLMLSSLIVLCYSYSLLENQRLLDPKICFILMKPTTMQTISSTYLLANFMTQMTILLILPYTFPCTIPARILTLYIYQFLVSFLLNFLLGSHLVIIDKERAFGQIHSTCRLFTWIHFI